MDYKQFIVFYWVTDEDGYMIKRNRIFKSELSACTFVLSICKDPNIRFDSMESVY